MKRVLGIVAEYNPFHNGHLHHINESKKISKCDYTVAIITGNFTQSGAPSIVDKWKKAKMAIDNGIDLVIELPVIYSVSSAENFADGAIKILNSLNLINYISFGAETSNLHKLNSIAEILYEEPEEFKNILIKELDKGVSFPVARTNALNSFINDDISNILNSPNNILGIEYLKSLKKHNSNIEPICIKRTNSDHNSSSINENSNISSATAIRSVLKDSKNCNIVKNLIPYSSFSILSKAVEENNLLLDLNIFSREIFYTLRKMSVEDIANLPDVSEGLEFLIKDASNSCNNLNTFFEKVKSKRYTYSRIQRILLYALLGITKKDMELSKSIPHPYIRILGFNNNGKYLLSDICKNNPDLQVIISVKKFLDSSTIDANILQLLSFDILASDIYTLGYKTGAVAGLDFSSKLL